MVQPWHPGQSTGSRLTCYYLKPIWSYFSSLSILRNTKELISALNPSQRATSYHVLSTNNITNDLFPLYKYIILIRDCIATTDIHFSVYYFDTWKSNNFCHSFVTKQESASFMYEVIVNFILALVLILTWSVESPQGL